MRQFRGTALTILVAALPFSAHAEKADRLKNMIITAKGGQLDSVNTVGILEGEVTIEQGTLRITAQRGEVRKGETGQFSGFVVGKPVQVRQKREGCDAWIEAQAERVEFDQGKDSLKLITNSRIKTGENELNGDVIVYNTVTEVFQVQGDNSKNSDGLVRMVLQPRDSGRDPCAGKSPTAASKSAPTK